MKIFSSVSAVLLSDVTIASPLRAHRGGLVSNHIASCPRNETVGSANVSVRSPRIPASHTFFQEIENAAQQAGVNSASLLHCCNTRDSI
jgi:hypothetical protein